MHNDYPLAPEKLEISQNMLSNYCSKIADECGVKIGGVNKLVPNLVLHYRNLQLYLSLGMKLVSINKVLKFKQSDLLKKYIDFNTDKRKHAANSFEKDFFKLMNNSIFGKAIENLNKIINVRLVNNVGNYKKYVSKPSFVSQKYLVKTLLLFMKLNQF